METIPNANLGSAVVAQAYVSRLDRYVPECEPVSLRGSRTSSNVPVYRLRPRKSRHSAGQEVPALANRLRKNLPSADNDRIIQVLSDWGSGTKSQSCVWISQTLQADLNLPMKTRKPDCAYLQLLYISEDRPFIILTLYKDTQGKDDVDAQASQDSVKHFTTVMSQLLASSLSNFCHCDFALLPCTLQWDALSTEVLGHEVNKQLTAIQKFYSGPKKLTKGTFTELRNAIEAVAGVTTVPALTESPSSCKRWLLLLKDDWRDTVSLLIEMLVQRDHEHPLHYTDESEFKMHVAALEAAKRLSFSSKVLIVTSPDGLHSQVLKCAGELVRQTEEEEERKVDLQVTTETAAADYVIYIDIPVDKIDRPSLTLVKRDVLRNLSKMSDVQEYCTEIGLSEDAINILLSHRFDTLTKLKLLTDAVIKEEFRDMSLADRLTLADAMRKLNLHDEPSNQPEGASSGAEAQPVPAKQPTAESAQGGQPTKQPAGSGRTLIREEVGRSVYVIHPKTDSTLTSKLTGPTQGATDCLEFAYLLNGLHTKLTVYIQPEGRTEKLIRSFTSNTDTDTPKWQFASVPVQQCVAFQVVLKSAATDAPHAVIAIDNIKFSRDGLCSTAADEADDSANVGAIAGAVTAVLIVVLIAVLVVGIFVWKRRSRRNTSQKEDTTKGSDMESPYEQPKDAYDYAEVGDSQIPQASATVDSGYADVMLAPSHSHTPANSRDIVHNVAPGRRDNQNSEEYDVLDLHGKGGKQQKPLEINSGEDLYHHINTQPTNQTKERTVTEVYATVQKKTKEPVIQEDVEQADEKATDEPSGVRFAAGAVACEVSADSAGDKTLDIEDGRQGSESEVVSFAGAN